MLGSSSLPVVRRLLFWALVAGIVGTGVELLLLGHFEGASQTVPLVLLGLSVPTLISYRLTRRGAGVVAMRAMMLLFLVAGCVGVGLHYIGNQAFELEMYPSLAGVALVRKAMTGATPVFAPGSMALLGLVGLAYTFCD